jgi:stage V sporulation protein B
MTAAVQLATPRTPRRQRSLAMASSLLFAGRMASMIGGFLLFALIARHGTAVAGVFRTAITFLAIMDVMPLLGMHRWLSNELAHRIDQRPALFAIGCWFAIGIALLSAIVYTAIAKAGFYEPDTAAALLVVAAATMPSGINLCVSCALVGLGHSDQSGLLSLFETLARSLTAIVLVLMGVDIFWVVVVYAVVRWIVAAIGFGMVRAHMAGIHAPLTRSLVRDFVSQVPNLAISLVGFLVIRNAGMLLLPWLRGEKAAGLYSASFQFFDLLLLVPTILTVSTNAKFAISARHSSAALRRETNRLVSMTMLFALPVAAFGMVLAEPVLTLAFGPVYQHAVPAFRITLVAGLIVSIDQILAMAMAVTGDYRSDRICMMFGATIVVVATCLAAGSRGMPPGVQISASGGAALALLVGTGATLVLRLYRLRSLVPAAMLVRILQRPLVAAVAAAAIIAMIAPRFPTDTVLERLLELTLAPVGALLYAAMLLALGGLSGRRLGRLRSFLAKVE